MYWVSYLPFTQVGYVPEHRGMGAQPLQQTTAKQGTIVGIKSKQTLKRQSIEELTAHTGNSGDQVSK